ncbi:MAG: SusC/RagA family TonB-linked outer membrane protein, partial [Verrucomicrobiota bacterium]
PTTYFKSAEQVNNFNAGRTTDWFDLMTNGNMHLHEQNISLTSRNEYLNYFVSFGFTDEKGYMIQEGYKRYNARINIENIITKWLTVGIQTFFTLSDYSGAKGSPSDRYIMPYDAAYKWWEGDGTTLNPLIRGGLTVNPLVQATEDYLKDRNNYFGNIYADLNLSFITKGLSYKINFSNNYSVNRQYDFQPFANNFQGDGGKYYNNTHDMSSDNILTYKRTFNDKHNLNVTLLYGFEKRKYDETNSSVSIFSDPTLGYNSLETGSAAQRNISSGAWEESSIYNMARLFYSYRDKYMLTGTVRRDGFSGFSENNKFGIFPSVALGWVPTKESFFPQNDILNYLKMRLSYGSIGNRTVGRYQTLAKVTGGFTYVDSKGTSLYGKEVTSLASPNLKWETTTGVNVGADFGLLKSKINGSIEYYNNNTTNLLYNVDIPSISNYSTFPANLGELHNSGIEITISSENLKTHDFSWNSSFAFSRNRNKLVHLLGFDNNSDGIEDDLPTSGLFIGKPLNVVYTVEQTGQLWQLNEKAAMPTYADYGTYKQIDKNADGKIDVLDNTIIGYKDPSYRFSISNEFKYKSWSLSVFINSVQGGKNFYYSDAEGNSFNGSSSSELPMEYTYPKYELYSYWTPENPNAPYARLRPKQGSTTRYAQRNFVRLQDVALNYNFNPRVLKKLKIENLKVYLSGKNLHTWTKWGGWDPETGQNITRDGLPVLKSYTLGLNLTF